MQYVKYVGLADVRVMAKEDWEKSDVMGQGTVVFSAANGYTLPESQFTEQALATLALDPSIVFTGERPSADERQNAAIEAAKNRLLARQSGVVVLHKQDEIETAG